MGLDGLYRSGWSIQVWVDLNSLEGSESVFTSLDNLYMSEFVLKGLDCLKRSEKVYMGLDLSCLEGSEWSTWVWMV